jgi:hypothetical protein
MIPGIATTGRETGMADNRIVRLEVSRGLSAAATVAAVAAACPDPKAAIAADLARALGPGAGFVSVETDGGRALRLAGSVRGAVGDDLAALRVSLDDEVTTAADALVRRLAAAGADGRTDDLDGDPAALIAAAALLARTTGLAFSISPLPLAAALAPPVAELLKGLRFADLPARPVTPLGAALLAEIAARRPAEVSEGRLIGHGTGLDGAPDRPLSVRALLLADGGDDDDEVVVICFEVDDMTGEEIGTAAERLRAVDGVLDLSLAARIGKKHRPSTEFRLLVRPADREAVERRCFLETSTIGLRRHTESRTRLPRRADHRPIGDGELPVKTVIRPNGVATTKAESDGLDRWADLAARRAAKTRAEGPGGTDG